MGEYTISDPEEAGEKEVPESGKLYLGKDFAGKTIDFAAKIIDD